LFNNSAADSYVFLPTQSLVYISFTQMFGKFRIGLVWLDSDKLFDSIRNFEHRPALLLHGAWYCLWECGFCRGVKAFRRMDLWQTLCG